MRDAIRSAALARCREAETFARRDSARHTRAEDRDAITHHYDVSNEFYGLWLDPRMVYSCAYFRGEEDGLEQAQLAKLDHICTKLRLSPGERFLDIGCGWGALIMRAAEEYGVDATGITLSENQFRLATERIRAAGLQDQCRVLLQDYRDHPGEGFYDKIASVGMFEHVGLRNLPVYFGSATRLLRERGLFLNHGITSSDVRNRAVGLGAGEFIGRYVFEKGSCRTCTAWCTTWPSRTWRSTTWSACAPHYAKTLDLWSGNYERRFPEAVAASSERTARLAHLPRGLRLRVRAALDLHLPGARVAPKETGRRTCRSPGTGCTAEAGLAQRAHAVAAAS